MEIRLHGRGGQGGVTCAKILAAAYAQLGHSVQTFGDYSGERSGAPVRAYTRVSTSPILNRNKVYEPDHLLVLDPSLLGDQVLSGLRPGGTLMINTPLDLASFAGSYDEYSLAVVDATKIARQHKIGTRTVVIVNTTLAGAFARVHDIPLDILEATYEDLGFSSNFAAASQAYEQVTQREALVVEPRAAPTQATGNGAVEALVDHKLSLALPLKTGTWSSLRPSYVKKLAPCNAFCPAGNDVIAFVRAAAAGQDEEAESILRKTTALAAVCGRVCPAPCMDGCNRSDLDGAVNIRGLERWVADRMQHKSGQPEPANPRFRVAIVGSGPAGLSAAYSLALSGHLATIIEKENELGGVLRTGIPSYRLARDILDREISAILELGVEARTGQSLDAADIVRLSNDFDAVILATGLQKLRPLLAKKSSAKALTCEGVQQGIEFLHRVNLAKDVKVSGHVVVLGGGNTAMDCARSALRCGADRVTVAYRRTRKEMPAIREEIEEALHEGVKFAFQKQPIGFEGRGQVEAVRLATVIMGEADDSGRRRPIVTDKHSVLACDMVLLALGQSADLSLLPRDWELRSQRFYVNGQAHNAFVAGDLATGDGTVSHAIGNGRRVADLVLQALGVDCTPFSRPDREEAVASTDIRMDYFERREPSPERKEPAHTRAADFIEVNHGLGSGSEAERCFSCGHCTECDICLIYCPEGIIRRSKPGYEVDYSYCKGCGICVTECPRRAMEMHEL